MAHTAVCARCESIPFDLLLEECNDPIETPEYELQPTLQKLQLSAQDGCRVCNLFLDYVKSAINDDGDLLQRSVILSRSLGPEYNVTIACAGFITKICCTLWSGRNLLRWYSSATDTPLGDNTGTNIDIFRALLHNCEHNHPLCNIASKDKKHPSRLIDVGDDLEGSSVCIVRGESVQRDPDYHGYLTLSHCWGKVPHDAPWKLTTSRLKSYYLAIPMAVLPRTFHDAIMTTRRLGQRYLWIDSICIIQDSKSDWTKEAQNMGEQSINSLRQKRLVFSLQLITIADIYQGSFCTLSSASDSAQGGLFLPRQQLVDHVEFRLACSTNGTPNHPGRVILHACNYGSAKASRGADEVPVYKRAWCLQERELSCRLIQFTSHDFQWTCATQYIIEGDIYRASHSISEAMSCSIKEHKNLVLESYNSKPADVASLAPKPGLWDLTRHYSPFLPKPKHWESTHNDTGYTHYKYWYSMASKFSNASIRHPSDRYAALYGLAKRHMSRIPDTYIAGIWKRELPFGLLWKGQPAARLRSPPRPTIAPSWSWIHLNAPVSFKYCTDFWGRHTKTKIPLKIDILHEQRTETMDQEHQFPILLVTGCLFWLATAKLETVEPESTARYKFIKLDTPGDLHFDTEEYASLLGGVYCLPLTVTQKGRRMREAIGIALVRCERGDAHTSAQQYRRVGLIGRIPYKTFAKVKPILFELI